MSLPAPGSHPFEPASLVGTTLDGRYVLSAHLATGGMGAVFRAQHVHLRKEVAVKVLRPDLTSSPEIVERFRREAEIASALEHDNIVRVSDFGRSESGHLFLVMELLTGESLFDRLRRERFLPPEEAVPVLLQICAALEAAHALGVIHRDLKPENVFLARTGSGREVAKILDFGIAKITDPTSESETQAGVVVGTPEYLSPEQAMGTRIDARADVYAVGLIAWRTLAGRHPFKAEDARSLLMMQATCPVPPLTEARPDLAACPGLVAAVAKACAKDAAERHQTAAHLRDDLAAALGPGFALPPSATPPVSTPSPRSTTAPAAPRDLEVAKLGTVRITPKELRARVALLVARAAARARLFPHEARERARSAARGARDGALGLMHGVQRGARAHPLYFALLGLALVSMIVVTCVQAWSLGRPAMNARALLAQNRVDDARAILDTALRSRPNDYELLLLRGHALHRIGRPAEGIEAYVAARARGPLDSAAFEGLVADLARERSVADKASRLLRDDPEGALPPLLKAAAGAPAAHRLRALALARDLGAEERVNRAEAYGALLSDPDCEIRRAAARRLGEIGDPAALPWLTKAAQAKVESKGLFGKMKQSPACSAAEADAAARRIEAAQLPAVVGKPTPTQVPAPSHTGEPAPPAP